MGGAGLSGRWAVAGLHPRRRLANSGRDAGWAGGRFRHCVLSGGSAALRAALVSGLWSGAAIFGAFFIATDPVTASTTPRGRLIYGAGIGVLVYVIRAFGGYPDGVAFSVLLMNIAAPTIDLYTQPRVFGARGR
jgi:Na+-translocating ferredoxin:NAD+ oxidoreductase RnfD subunit